MSTQVNAVIVPSDTKIPANLASTDVRRRQDLFELGPKELITRATEIADVLNDVIQKQKLFQDFRGKKHVTIEGWVTLGNLLGILPREREVKECTPPGSYEAVVELYSVRTQQIVGVGSGVCMSDERTWKDREKYARRSMAITRATGKAFRLGFSWIMSLAGYEGCPAEEMPEELKTKEKVVDDIYNGQTDSTKFFVDWIIARLQIDNIAAATIMQKMVGKPYTHIKQELIRLEIAHKQVS